MAVLWLAVKKIFSSARKSGRRFLMTDSILPARSYRRSSKLNRREVKRQVERIIFSAPRAVFSITANPKRSYPVSMPKTLIFFGLAGQYQMKRFGHQHGPPAPL